jgi:UPF0755 protein
MKRAAPPLILLALLLAATATGLYRQYLRFTFEPLRIVEAELVQVDRGATVRAVLEDLEVRGMTRLDWRWRVFTRLHPVTIQAGEYALRPGMRPQELLELLASGKVVTYQFTIIEGWTFAQLQAALRADPVLVKRSLEFADAAGLLAAIGLPAGNPEGWFLPETYQFVRGDADLDILRRALDAMREVLANAWERRTQPHPLSSEYELLILASIIEKESSLASERADIAGVFTRRLQQGWRLETDPTVIYGLGEAFDGDIRSRDLRTDNPYNTYTRKGLPPTPIALAGKSAIMAAARPAPGTAMFFVADGQGGHFFSDTLDEHNAAVRRMLKRDP